MCKTETHTETHIETGIHARTYTQTHRGKMKNKILPRFRGGVRSVFELMERISVAPS